jgi:hypothetical protein
MVSNLTEYLITSFSVAEFSFHSQVRLDDENDDGDGDNVDGDDDTFIIKTME